MSTRSADAESRDNTPDGHEDSTEKRTGKKRKVLSCFACRDRKMKCDRVYPICGRCQKTGRADQCTYDPRLLQGESSAAASANGATAPLPVRESGVAGSNQTDTSSEALRWRLRVQDEKIQMLERKLAASKAANNTSQYQDLQPEEPKFDEVTMFRGKGFKTQFHGTTSVMSMIARYRELQSFTREALVMDHSMLRIKSDFKTFRDQRKILAKEKIARTHGTDDEIFAALPDKETVDIHVALYFHTWETTYRIIHEPSFWKEYHEFWRRRPSDDKNVGFAVLVILMVAATKCTGAKDDVFVGDSAADRDSASSLIETCDTWLNKQSRKRLTLRYFQLQCLALMAKRVNCVKLKQDWLTAGDLLRLALSAGMHRDPSNLASSRISLYEKEMKKRLWFTIAELELQSSIDCGLQSSLTNLYFDTPPPANLPDEAFSVETTQMPVDRPAEYFTPASYLIFAARSLPLRIHLTQLLNDPSAGLSYTDVLAYDAQLHAVLATLPPWIESRAAVPSALLDLQLRQFLVIMHKPYASNALHNPRLTYSLSASIDASSSMISTHEALITKSSLVLLNFRNDAIRVSMTLSRLIYANCARLRVPRPAAPPQPQHESHFAPDPMPAPASHTSKTPFKSGWASPDSPLALPVLPAEPFIQRTLCIAALTLLSRVGAVFETKVMRLGTGYMEYWLLSSAISILPSPPSSSSPSTPLTSTSASTTSTIPPTDAAVEEILTTRCKAALDRMATLSFRVLALQKDPGSAFASSLWNTMSHPTSAASVSARTPSTAGSVLSRERAGGGAGGEVRAGVGVGVGVGHGGMDLGFDAPGKMHGDGMGDMAFDMLGQGGMGSWGFGDFWSFDLAGEF